LKRNAPHPPCQVNIPSKPQWLSAGGVPTLSVVGAFTGMEEAQPAMGIRTESDWQTTRFGRFEPFRRISPRRPRKAVIRHRGDPLAQPSAGSGHARRFAYRCGILRDETLRAGWKRRRFSAG